MKVLLHYRAGPGLAERLSHLPGLDLTVVSDTDDAAFARALPEAEAIWHVLRPLSAADIAAAPRLRLIQKIGVGVNTIDLEAAKARGIAVCNLPGTNSRAVAELTLLLMLAALRRAAHFDAATRAGQGWSQPPELQDNLFELGGRTVGLVGYGAIPALLAPVLAALGCRLLYTARSPKEDAEGSYRTLAGLLSEADIVSLHIPETPETRGLIDAGAIARMKKGAVLVNTARGGLVDQAALTEALHSGHLAAAGLDVFAEEPVDPRDPLFSLPNVVVTPHIAWLTTGTFDRSFAIAAENVRRLAAAEPLLHQVA